LVGLLLSLATEIGGRTVLPVTHQILTLKPKYPASRAEEVLAYSCRQGSQLLQPHPALASEALVTHRRPEIISSQISTLRGRLKCGLTSQAE
jgi:hypothetical protein